MGIVVRGDNLKGRLRFVKRLACLLLAGFICVSTAVMPYAQALPAETAAPAVTVVSEEFPEANDIMQSTPAEDAATTPSEPAVTSSPEVSGEIPSVTDTPADPSQPLPDVTDITDITEPSITEPSITEPSITEPSITEPSITESSVTEPSDTEPSDTTDITDTSDTSDVTDDSGDVTLDIADILGEIDPDDNFVDEDGIMFFTLARGSNGSVTWKVGINSSGYYTLLVEGNGDVPSDILSQPDVAPYINQITRVQINNGVTSIGENAFRGLPDLTEVRFEDNSTLTNISNGAFADCPLLRTVNLESCHALAYIDNTNSNYVTSDADADRLRVAGAFSNSGITSIVLPSSLQKLGHCTFYNCKNLTDVRFEENINELTLGADVFENCTALKSINLEGLRGNINTSKLYISQYNQGLFHNCESLESITVPSGFGYNGSPLLAMFNGCRNLMSIEFVPNTNITGKNDQINNIISGTTERIEVLDLRNLTALTEIGDYNIRGKSLSIVYLPASLETLKIQPFGDCPSLTAVVFPEGSNLKTIGTESFTRDENLVSVNLENTKVETIGNYAFRNDPALTEITFPATLNEIRWCAFENCTSLSRINYNAVNLNLVDDNIFNGVTSKINVNIGGDVQTINESFLHAINGHVGDFTFAPNCRFTVNGSVSNLSGYDTPFKAPGDYKTDEHGNLYRIYDNKKTLIMASKDSSGTFTVPADVTGITSYAFKDCSGIIAIDFANVDSIESLEAYAFADCNNLENLTANGSTTDDVKTDLEDKCVYPDTLFVNTKVSGSSSDVGIGGTLQTNGYTFSEVQLTATKYTDKLLTGEIWTVHAAVSNGNDNSVYRLYVKCEDKCTLPTMNESTRKGPIKTDDSDIYYYEVKSNSGDTIQFDMQFDYPNGTAPGKKVQVWAVQGNESSFTDLGNGVIYPGSGEAGGIVADNRYLQMEWTTKPLTHSVTKKAKDDIAPSFTMKNGQPTLTNLIYDIGVTFSGESTSSLGRDNAVSAGYSDVITLPTGLKWQEGLKGAIESRAYNYTIKSEGETKTATLYASIGGINYNVCSVVLDSAASLNLTGLKLEWDESANAPRIIWQVKSSNQNQLPTINAHLNIGDIIVGGAGFENLAEADKLNIHNKVDTKVSHQFSESDARTAECDIEVTKQPGRLSLSKEMLNKPEYLGEDVKYKVTVENNTSVNASAKELSADDGALVVHDGLYQRNGEQIQVQYIKPENIEKLFADEDGQYLRLEISKAVITNMNLADGDTSVMTVDGEEPATLTPQNTANVSNNYNVSVVNSSLPEGERLDERHEWHDKDNVISRNAVITLEKVGGNIQVTVTNGGEKDGVYTTASGKTLAQIFDDIGYIVTPSAKYDLYWTYPADYTFEAGCTKEIVYTATVKDTFMYTPKDKHYFYNYNLGKEIIEVFNHAEIQNPANGAYNGSLSEVGPEYVKRDMEVYKGYFVNGEERTDGKEFVIANGDELEYSLDIYHFGNSYYELLPCVDSMVGPQVLLAEMDKNPDLVGKGLPEYNYKSKEDGSTVKCYVLNKAGTYNNVWLGGYCADSVTVSKPIEGEGDGLKTIIKWYFKDTVPRAFNMKIRYKALVSIDYTDFEKPEEGITYKTYTLDNTVWLNDHPEHRIYDYIGMPVSVNQFKKIAYKKNGELLYGERQSSCPVGEEDEITYRFEFSIRGNSELVITDKDIFDILPATGNAFKWSYDNVKISYEGNTNSMVHINYGGTVLNGLKSDNAEWQIVDEADGKQKIVWNDGFKITMDNPGNDYDLVNVRTAYIYVTLKFPNGDAWNNYLAEIGGSTIINTLNCNGLTSNVTHVLSNSCKAFIQKGVYETGSFARDTYWGPNNYYRGDDRLHYATTLNAGEAGVHTRLIDNLVTYYIVIANTGKTNLYLAPIYDVLPEGFEFYGLNSMATGYAFYVGDRNKNLTVECGWGGTGEDGNRLITSFSNSNIKLLNPKVTVVDSKQKIGDRQVIKFSIIDGNNAYDFPNTDEKGKFLKPNEAIQFGITCITSSERIDPTENLVTMEYLNYTDSELVIDRETIANNNISNGLTELNDGSRESFTNAELFDKIGGKLEQIQTGEDIRWITSDVDIYPGEIIPGIEKTVSKQIYKVESGNVTEEVLWTVASCNDGTEGITNYQIVDTLDYPLRFEGAFRYQIEYNDEAIHAGNGNGGSKWILIADEYGNTNDYQPEDWSNQRWLNLFTIDRNNDGSMTIWSNKLNNGEKYESIKLYPNGAKKKLNVRLMHRGEGHLTRDIYIEFKTTPVTGSDNNTYYQETLVVTFADDLFSIVPNGRSVFEIPSKMNPNAYGEDKIGTFNNTASIVPTQKFNKTASQGKLTDYQGSAAVENSAQITTYSDSPTTSVKKIEEVGIPENNALSTNPTYNTILVDSVQRLVKYTLTVTNGDAAQPMKQLVIIDNLPEVGDKLTISDRERGSEFKVSLADNPGFVITVTPKNGTPESLKADDYSIQYSTGSVFDRSNISTSTDWTGGDSDKWINDPTNARSFRIVITKNIKAGDRVDISFNAKLDESAKPGQVAWNSFGYCFETNVTADADSKWLYAAPRVVGVGLPELPDIQKRCVINLNGTVSDYNVEQAETFNFFIYKGEPLDAIADYSAGGIERALKDASIEYASFPLTVEAGKALSDKLPLADITVPADWRWEVGGKYTIIEAASEDYINQPVIHSFTYQRDKHDDIVVENIRSKSIEITKVNKTDTSMVLKGAVFGLYTLDINEKMSDNDVASYAEQYGLTLEKASTVERNGKTYYLSKIAETDEDGKLRFDKLKYEDYVIKELKAPKGFYIIPHQSVQDCDLTAVESIETTIQNRKAAIMPATGGQGSGGIIALGALLAIIGAEVFVMLLRRRAIARNM